LRAPRTMFDPRALSASLPARSGDLEREEDGEAMGHAVASVVIGGRRRGEAGGRADAIVV
jgi:hypothetical protein